MPDRFTDTPTVPREISPSVTPVASQVPPHAQAPSLSPALLAERLDPETFPVAVIGAGISGLTCAQELQSSGIETVVFDKARAPGGRISTRRRDDFEWDMGAQMMTANSREFMAQIREWQFRGLVRRWRGRFVGPQIGDRDDGPFYVGLPRMGALARSLGRGLDARYPVRIDAMSRDPQTKLWHLSDDQGQDQGAFRAVLSTLPKAQTQALVAPWTELSSGLRSSGTLVPTWSVFLVFRHRFDINFDAKTFIDGPIKSLFRNSAKPERPDDPECWVLHADPQLSAKFIDYPAQSVVEDMVAALEFSTEKRLPPIVYARAHRWRYALAIGQSGFRCQFDNRLRLGFGGDWVQPPVDQFGGVEAAYLSGRALALQVKTLLP